MLTRSYRVHGSRFQIDEDSSGDIFATGGFVVVNVDSLQLEVRITMVSSSGVNAMFVRDDFPELKKCPINDKIRSDV